MESRPKAVAAAIILETCLADKPPIARKIAQVRTRRLCVILLPIDRHHYQLIGTTICLFHFRCSWIAFLAEIRDIWEFSERSNTQGRPL